MRGDLVRLLVARGFGEADAAGFVARLSDEQVRQDLAWHQWEARWFAQGSPTTWPPAIRAQVVEHYLGPAHRLAAWDVMAMSTNTAPAHAIAPAATDGTGMVVVGVVLVLAAAGVAYALAKR